TIYPLLDILAAGGYRTYSVIYISVYGTGAGVTQMVMSQDVVSPDDFGGISIGVIQNPLEEKLLDIYVSSFEPLYIDVGDGAFTNDGGLVTIFSTGDSTLIPMGKIFEDESYYSFSYEYTYPSHIFVDSISTHYGEASSYHLYHAEYMIPSNGNYDLTVSGQDVSGNDVSPDAASISVNSINSSAKTIVSNAGDFSITFDQGSVQGTHTVSLISIPESLVNQSTKLKSFGDYAMINVGSDHIALSKVYQVGPQYLELNKPVKVRFSYDIASINEEDLPYVGIYQYQGGQWTGLPTRLEPTGGFMEIEVNQLGTFQVQKGISVLDHPTLPYRFALHQNYPNPFNPITKINFELPEYSTVTLKVFNVLGQEVAVLVDNAEYKAGYHSIVWNGKNPNGKSVSSGTYFYMIKAGQYTSSNKMVLIR
ncbi:gliding motility-associated C-terminal domain-containing protein, partial [Candidatus Pacearchaeota archaeon]|nr:gliding motility-associated C-terminal domain-containing protein [Candidatus Pacearchaeota archaeon]